MRQKKGPAKILHDKNWIGFYIRQRGAGLCPDNAGFFGRMLPDFVVG
jgi:hypothetical protein